MIHVGLIPNVFEPQKRESATLQFRDGMTTRDVASGVYGEGEVAVWHNGALTEEPALLSDGDFVHLCPAPAGIVGGLFAALIKYIVTAVILAAIYKHFFYEEPTAPDDSVHNYYGFQNKYRPEGDALPVVFGRLRVSPPVINQNILGYLPAYPTSQLVMGDFENLNTLFVVSHGPIEGFENLRAQVNNKIEWNNVLGGRDPAFALGAEINGVDAGQFETTYEIRTGTGAQTPIRGAQGFVNYTDAGVSYDLGFEVPYGVSLIDNTPSGKLDYEDRMEAESTEYVSQFLSTKSDRMVVQLGFPRGLYKDHNNNGDLENNTRRARVQYWVTDASGDAEPDYVHLLPSIEITNDESNAFSVDYPITLENPENTVGGGGTKGYAFVENTTPARIVVTGSSASGSSSTADLGLLHPGSASNVESRTVGSFDQDYATWDPNLQFSFASWVSVPEWVGGWQGIKQPQSWLFYWGRDTASGTTWPFQSVASAANLWQPDPLRATTGVEGSVQTDRYGVAAALAVASTNTLASLGIPGGGDDPKVYLKLYAWEANVGVDQTTEGPRTDYGYMSWWISELPVGTVSQFASATPNVHLGFTYDQTTFTLDGSGLNGGKATVKAYVNGYPHVMILGPPGGNIPVGSAGTSSAGEPGYLYGHSPSEGPLAGQKHVPWRFFTDTTTVLKIGGWDNVTGTGAAFAESQAALCEYLFYDGIITEPEHGGAAWYVEQIATLDDTGNLNASVTTTASIDPLQNHVKIACPFDSATDIVATDFYKNWAYPAATTQAGGALEMEDVGITAANTTGSPVHNGQTLVAEGNYYIVEVFVGAITVSETDDQNTCVIESITSFESQPYSYPSVALISSTIKGADQINNSQPDQTFLVYGKQVNVWDGESVDNPSFVRKWSDNPAWVALDVLSNQDYGLGSIFSPDGTYDNFELPQFFEWSAFCEEGVPDAYGALKFFGVRCESPNADNIILRFGQVTGSDATPFQRYPSGWSVGNHLSITQIDTSTGLPEELVTKDDVEGGFNSASNRLEILDIDFGNASTADADYHGYTAFFDVTLQWNRDLPFPSGSPNAWYFADDQNLTFLGKASGYEKRCSYNGQFAKKDATAWDSLIELFQVGRAMPLKVGRKLMPIWDRPRDPIAMFSQANIITGTFELSYSDAKMSPNSMEMEILDEDRNFQGQTVLVDHPSIQTATTFQQVRKQRIAFSGCTSRSQAIREATYRLNKFFLSLRTARFEVGPDAINVLPGDRILVAHDVPKYGESGRLPAAMVIFNTHHGANSLYSSWTLAGGDCTISSRSLLQLFTQAEIAASESDYSGGVTLGYSVPTGFGQLGEILAGVAGDPGYERSPFYAAQHVCVADGLYPYPGNPSTEPYAPFDRIDSQTKKVCFSAYFKEPGTLGASAVGGASKEVALMIYRFCDDQGFVSNGEHGYRFEWSSGVLSAVSSGNIGASGCVTAAVSSEGSGWYRASVVYDNNATGGGGAGAVGEYLQARLFYTWDDDTLANQPTFYDVDDGGKGNQFFYFGDPLALDKANSNGSYHWDGAYARLTSGAKIVHDLTVAPPFYANDTTAGTGTPGDRGYVLLFDHIAATTDNKMVLNQAVTLPTGSGVATWQDEKLCFTGFFRRFSSGESCSIVVRFAKGTAVASSMYSGDGATITLDYDGAGSWTTGEGSVATPHVTVNSRTVSAVRINSNSNDADWVQLDVSLTFAAATGLGTSLGVNVGSARDFGADGSGRFYAWGFRLHGVDAVGSGTINPYPHQGTHMWGPMYEPNSGASVGTFSAGAQLKLDRDVTFTTGKEYEIYLRSSFQRDVMLGADVTEVVTVASKEVPASGSTTKTARNWIEVSTPLKMFPRVGDLYSFGESGSSTEDFIVKEVSTKPDSMIRKIECIQYSSAVYEDTTFADIVNPSTDDDPHDGGVGDYGGTGSTDGGYGVTYGGPMSTSLIVQAESRPYRTFEGGSRPTVKISWRQTDRFRRMPFREVRLWCAKINTDGTQGAPRYITSMPAGVNSYRYEDEFLNFVSQYQFWVQPVGRDGTAPPFYRCPTTRTDIRRFSGLPSAPQVEIAIHGFKQVYDIDDIPVGEVGVGSYEGRIGGWLISSPAWIVDSMNRRFTSDALLPLPTNSAGDGQATIYVRSKLSTGQFGKVTTVTGTEAFPDVLSSRQLIAENDYSAALDGSLDVNLYITSDVLHWNAASSSLGPVYYKCNELDAGTPRRTVVNASIAGYQVRHETLGDTTFTLGDQTGSNWSLEGPMHDDGGNASVIIQWRWTSGSSITGETWKDFVPGEVYARKVQLRLKWTRKNAGDQVKLTRFTTICNDVPATTQVDGGTF
jgi:hypothetical protein